MPLTIDDFCIPLFNTQSPKRRRMPARSEVYGMIDDQNEDFLDDLDPFPRKKEPVIEGVTFTDEYHQVGYTYHELDGILFLNYWDDKNKKNVRLFEEKIETMDEFEVYLKKADKKIKRLEN